MHRSLTRNLLCASIVLLLAACESPYAMLREAGRHTCLPALRPGFSSVVYTTHVDVMGKHLSGLLVFKRMPDQSVRVVFSNEMGLKFFDFGYAVSGFTVHYCIPQLNKAAVINQLHSDLGALIMEEFEPASAVVFASDSALYHTIVRGKMQTYYITDANCTGITRIEQAHGRHKKVIMNVKGNTAGFYDSVYIAHLTYNFTVSLKQLQR